MTVGVVWWQEKIQRLGDRAFGQATSNYAIPAALDTILRRSGATVSAQSLSELARELGIPLKLLPRARATLTRLGLARATFESPLSVTIDSNALSRTKNPAQMKRRRIPVAQAASLKKVSSNRCGCCGEPCVPGELVVDHLIPLSLRGADDWANCVVVKKEHNGTKWDRFTRGQLKRYRRERVTQPFGIRFRRGYFWPVINGRPRYADRPGRFSNESLHDDFIGKHTAKSPGPSGRTP